MTTPDMEATEIQFKDIISHCKEYGFIYPGSEIYDGIGAVYDYGPLGVELKNRIKAYWYEWMTRMHDNIVGIDTAIFMHPTVWKASGHVDAFTEPINADKATKNRKRADQLRVRGRQVGQGHRGQTVWPPGPWLLLHHENVNRITDVWKD
jgi:glycyl-tRNA synthetase